MLTAGQLVVVGTDLSEAADAAVQEAEQWCRLWGAPLLIVHVLDESPDMRAMRIAEARDRGLPEQPAEATDALTAIGDAARERAGIDVTTLMTSGSPYAELCRIAEHRRAGLVVVGGTGGTGIRRALLGSVAERVVRFAHGPVLVARGSNPSDGVVAATDLSDASLPALRAATGAASRFGSSLTFLYCVSIPGFSAGPAGQGGAGVARADVERLLADASLAIAPNAERIVLDGDPARSVIELAEQRGLGLVVVGARGRTGLTRVLLGSVAERVVRHAACSVLAVRMADG